MRADGVGIIASTLCALHCLAGAILAGASGAVQLFNDERLELVFAVVAVVVAVFALTSGFKKHGRKAVVLLGLLGVGALAASRFDEWAIVGVEVLLSVLGAALLVTAHVLNLRALRAGPRLNG